MKVKTFTLGLASALLLGAMLLPGCSNHNPTPQAETTQPTAGQETKETEMATVPSSVKETFPAETTEPQVNENQSKKEENPVAESPEVETEAVKEQETEPADPVPTETDPPQTEPPETEPPATEPIATEPPTTEPPSTEAQPELDYGAVMAYGNSYAADVYGCEYKDTLDWNADGTGYDYGGDYPLEMIMNNGGQEMMNRLMADKVDSTFGAWRFPDGCAGIGVKCFCYEDNGTVWFYVFYG